MLFRSLRKIAEAKERKELLVRKSELEAEANTKKQRIMNFAILETKEGTARAISAEPDNVSNHVDRDDTTLRVTEEDANKLLAAKARARLHKGAFFEPLLALWILAVVFVFLYSIKVGVLAIFATWIFWMLSFQRKKRDILYESDISKSKSGEHQ